MLLNKPINADRNNLCLTRHFMNDWAVADQTLLRKQLIIPATERPATQGCCFIPVSHWLSVLWFRWLDWCSGELLHCHGDGLITELLLYQFLIIIQIFSCVSCASWELTLTVFVLTLRGTAVIMHVRDSTMAFSWNCPPTHVGFNTFFLLCSQAIPRICKRVWHSNNYSTQWFRSMWWNVVALSVISRSVRVLFLSFVTD